MKYKSDFDAHSASSGWRKGGTFMDLVFRLWRRGGKTDMDLVFSVSETAMRMRRGRRNGMCLLDQKLTQMS